MNNKLSSSVVFAVREGACGRRFFQVNELDLYVGSETGLLDDIEQLVADQVPRLVVTANVDQIVCLRKSLSLRDAYQEASIRSIDGAPLVRLARFMGMKSPKRNTGADLLPRIVERLQGKNATVAIVGGREEASTEAVRQLRETFPSTRVRAVSFPFVSDVLDTSTHRVIEELRTLGPAVVFLCLGSPKQEAWYLAWKDVLPPAVYVGAGAAVDFAANKRRRAPLIVQRMGGEWMWRLFQEPRRMWKRYLWDSRYFFSIAFKSLWRNKH